MQAAGRMRGLDYGQQLLMVATPNVSSLICERAGGVGACVGLGVGPPPAMISVTPKMILDFVISNSIAASRHALVLYGAQGVQFALTQDSRLRSGGHAKVFTEVNHLSALYNQSLARAPVFDAHMSSALRRGIGQIDSVWMDMILTVDAYVREESRGPNGVAIAPAALDEECEREVQLEVQLQEETEPQIAKATPLEEISWDPRHVTVAASPADLVSRTGSPYLRVHPLRDIMPADLLAISWPSCLSVTACFMQSVKAGGPAVSAYWRPPGWVLVFPDQSPASSPRRGQGTQALLLSEVEAEQVLRLFQALSEGQAKASKAVLIRLCDLRDATSAILPGVSEGLASVLVVPAWDGPRGRLSGALSAADIEWLAAAMLFAGETKFGAGKQQAALRSLMPSKPAATQALDLPDRRGTRALVERSDLQSVCNEVVRCP